MVRTCNHTQKSFILYKKIHSSLQSVKRELTTNDIDDVKETTIINGMNKKQKIDHNRAMLRNKDEFIIVWYDEQPVLHETINLLESLCNDIYYFQKPADCLMYIESLNVKDHVFLIVPSLCTIVDDAHKLRQVDTIF